MADIAPYLPRRWCWWQELREDRPMPTMLRCVHAGARSGESQGDVRMIAWGNAPGLSGKESVS